MLGQHFGGLEGAVLHRAQRDHALAFAEQRRQHAIEGDRHGTFLVGHREMHHGAGAALDAALLHQAAQPERDAVGHRLGRHVGGAAEIKDVFLESADHQPRRTRTRHKQCGGESQAAFLLGVQ